MFQLLSKQTTVFSIPVYMICLLGFVALFNVFNFDVKELISSIIVFCGVATGYFLFSNIGLSGDSQLPIFIYTVFIFTFYFGNLTFPFAVAFLGTNLLVMILTSPNEYYRKQSYFLVGSLIGILYFVMPQIWPIITFILLNIITATSRIPGNILKMLYGLVLMGLSYLGIYYLTGYPADAFTRLVPEIPMQFINSVNPLIFLLIPAVLALYGAIDHFSHYRLMSPVTKYKYLLLFLFFLSLLIVISFYMDQDFEYLLFLALPASIIISRGMIFMRNKIAQEVSFWLLLLSAVLFKLAYYF